VSALLIIVGLGAGTLGSMIGVGGGLIMTPALTFMGFAPAQISSTSLFAVTFTSASSTISYAKQKKIHYHFGLKMAAVAIPGAIAGAFISSVIAIEPFKIYFGILLMFAGIYIAYNSSFTKERQNGPTGNNRKSILLRPLFYSGALGAGIISSLFGVGGGDNLCSAPSSCLGHDVNHRESNFTDCTLDNLLRWHSYPRGSRTS